MVCSSLMRFLALDIGTRRTGVAFLDDTVEIPLPLESITHASPEELVTSLMTVIAVRHIDWVIIGLPLLPSGAEGKQAHVSRNIAEALAARGVGVELMDERHTTPRFSSHKHALPVSDVDGDAAAACALLNMRRKQQWTEKKRC